MFCRNCGVEIPDDSHFCPKCGTRVVGQKYGASSSTKIKPTKIQSGMRIESRRGRDGCLLRDVSMLVGGLVAVGIGYALWIGSTVNAYLSAKASVYYAAFGRNAPNASQWAAGIFGAIVNIVGAICLYIAVGPLAQRFGAWRRQNKVIGTILAAVICLAVLVCFSLKTAATGEFGVWDYLIMAAILGGIWMSGKQNTEQSKEELVAVKHASVSCKSYCLRKFLLVGCGALAFIVVCWGAFAYCKSKNSMDNKQGASRITDRSKTRKLTADSKYNVHNEVYRIEQNGQDQTIREKRRIRKFSDDELDFRLVANAPGKQERDVRGVMTPGRDSTTGEELDTSVFEPERTLVEDKFLAAFSEGRFEEAAKFLNSVDHNNVNVQFALGVMCQCGRGVMKSETEAVKWFRRAAEQGCIEAQNELGKCYWNGSGVAKDEAEGLRWIRKAAEGGNPDSQVVLGLLYQIGVGVNKDEVESVHWLRKAASQGNGDAQKALQKKGLAW